MLIQTYFHSQAQAKRSAVRDAFVSDFETRDCHPRYHRPNGRGGCLECCGLNFKPVTPHASSEPLPFAQATHAQIRELQAALGAEHGLAPGSTLGTATGPGLGVKEVYICIFFTNHMSRGFSIGMACLLMMRVAKSYLLDGRLSSWTSNCWSFCPGPCCCFNWRGFWFSQNPFSRCSHDTAYPWNGKVNQQSFLGRWSPNPEKVGHVSSWFAPNFEGWIFTNINGIRKPYHPWWFE